MIEWLIPWWGWFIVGFALLLLELSSPGGFYFLFFGVGAISVGAVAGDRSRSVGSAHVLLDFFHRYIDSVPQALVGAIRSEVR